MLSPGDQVLLHDEDEVQERYVVVDVMRSSGRIQYQVKKSNPAASQEPTWIASSRISRHYVEM